MLLAIAPAGIDPLFGPAADSAYVALGFVTGNTTSPSPGAIPKNQIRTKHKSSENVASLLATA